MKKTLEIEVWKDIPGYEGKYQASTEGKIRSLDREITQIGRWGKPFTRKLKGQILRPGRYAKSGHVSVVLGRGTNGRPVHQLVLLTFIGPAPEGMEVLHKDGNPLNNKLNNLKYGTRLENIMDNYRHKGVWRDTTQKQAEEVKRLLSQNLKATDIAERVQLPVHTVYSIKKGGHFKWIP